MVDWWKVLSPDLDVTLWVNEEIFRLEVTVDELERMQVLECQNDLCTVEPRMRFAG